MRAKLCLGIVVIFVFFSRCVEKSVLENSQNPITTHADVDSIFAHRVGIPSAEEFTKSACHLVPLKSSVANNHHMRLVCDPRTTVIPDMNGAHIHSLMFADLTTDIR
mgnify:CR=1 FL=1